MRLIRPRRWTLLFLTSPNPTMISLIVLTYEVGPAPPLDLAILDEPKPNHNLSHSAHLWGWSDPAAGPCYSWRAQTPGWRRRACSLSTLSPWTQPAHAAAPTVVQYNTYVQSTPLRLANKAIYSSYLPIQCYGSVLNKEEKHLININPFLLFFYCLKQAEGGRYRY